MLYAAYQAQADLMAPFRIASSVMADAISHLPQSLAEHPLVRRTAANAEIVALWGLSHRRPAFGIDSVVVAGEEVAVTEVPAHVTPFGTLLHFAKDASVPQPPVLLVAPMSGHFSTPGPCAAMGQVAQRWGAGVDGVTGQGARVVGEAALRLKRVYRSASDI